MIDQTMLWLTFIGMIVLPITGAVFNNLITKKIDDMKDIIEKFNDRIDTISINAEEKEQQTYAAINGQRNAFEHQLKEYVLEKIYKQGIDFQRDNTDEKFKSMLAIVTTQYASLENRINASDKNLNDKIDNLKSLIKDNINHNKNGE